MDDKNAYPPKVLSLFYCYFFCLLMFSAATFRKQFVQNVGPYQDLKCLTIWKYFEN